MDENGTLVKLQNLFRCLLDLAKKKKKKKKYMTDIQIWQLGTRSNKGQDQNQWSEKTDVCVKHCINEWRYIISQNKYLCENISLLHTFQQFHQEKSLFYT